MRTVVSFALLAVVALLTACGGDKKDDSPSDKQQPTFVATGRSAGQSSGTGGAPEILRSSAGGSVGPAYPVSTSTSAATDAGGLTMRHTASAVVPADDAFAVAVVQGRSSGPVPPSSALSSRDQTDVVTALQAQGFVQDDIVFTANANYGPFATIAVHMPTADLVTRGKQAIDAIETVTGRSQASGARFGLKDCLSALAPLRKDAIAGAAADAQAVASDASLNLGPLVAMSETAPAPIIYGPPQVDPCDAANSTGPLTPGSSLASLDARPEVSLSLQVTLTYSLDGNGGGVSATGSGKATAKANEAYVVVVAVPSIPSPPFGAQPLSKKQHDDIIAKLKDLKLSEDDIEISTPSLGGGQTVVSVETGVDNLPQRGKDITAAVEDVLGRSQQQGVVFSHSNCDAVLAEARKQALADAKRRAQALADAASLQLGQLVSLSEPQPVAGVPNVASSLCDQDPTQLLSSGAYGAIIQPFDAPPEVTIATQVLVSYAFTGP